MQSRVTYNANARVFIWRGPYEERYLPRDAKFRLHPEKKIWYTNSYPAAARLREIMDELAKKELDRKLLKISPWDAPLLFPPEETPQPHQIEGALFSLSRNRSYIAFDPGLGKTIVAVMIMNSLVAEQLRARVRRDNFNPDPLFVYVCPRFLTGNVEDEFLRWRTFDGPVRILDKDPEKSEWPSLILAPDSLLHRDAHREELCWYIAYALEQRRELVLFVDEAHRFNFNDSERSRALLGYDYEAEEKSPAGHVSGIADFFDRVVYLSGTPTNGRPMELFPILNHSAPETIGFAGYYDYGDRYGGKESNAFGKTYLGAANVPELAKRIEPFYLRKRKSILKLKPKIEEALIVSGDMDPRLAKLDAALLAKYSPEDLVEAEIKRQAVADKILDPDDELHFATYRRLLGEFKVPFTVEIIRSLLEETEESILVGTLHTAPLLALAAHLGKYKPYVVNGEVKAEDRLALVKDFQLSKERRLFLGNIKCMGIGYTLTKATRVLLMEFSYSPSDNDQFIDRTHRIGQGGEVFAQYITLKNSIDRKILANFLKKKKTVEII